jgi:hypothetical protein
MLRDTNFTGSNSGSLLQNSQTPSASAWIIFEANVANLGLRVIFDQDVKSFFRC